METGRDNRGSGGSGRGRGGGGCGGGNRGGKGGNYQRHQHHQQVLYQGGGGGGRGGGGVPTQIGGQQPGNCLVQKGQSGGAYRPPHLRSGQGLGPTRVETSEGSGRGGSVVGPAGGGGGVWTGRSWTLQSQPQSSSPSPSQRVPDQTIPISMEKGRDNRGSGGSDRGRGGTGNNRGGRGGNYPRNQHHQQGQYQRGVGRGWVPTQTGDQQRGNRLLQRGFQPRSLHGLLLICKIVEVFSSSGQWSLIFWFTIFIIFWFAIMH